LRWGGDPPFQRLDTAQKLGGTLEAAELHLTGLDPLPIADFLEGDVAGLFRRDFDPVALASVLDAKAAGYFAGRELAKGLGDRHLLQGGLGAGTSPGEVDLNFREKEFGEKSAGNEFRKRRPAVQVAAPEWGLPRGATSGAAPKEGARQRRSKASGRP
jgi:hypothetical protein